MYSNRPLKLELRSHPQAFLHSLNFRGFVQVSCYGERARRDMAGIRRDVAFTACTRCKSASGLLAGVPCLESTVRKHQSNSFNTKSRFSWSATKLLAPTNQIAKVGYNCPFHQCIHVQMCWTGGMGQTASGLSICNQRPLQAWNRETRGTFVRRS